MPPLPTLPSPPRLILYHQTHHHPDGTHISLLPLLTHGTGITHLILAAIHLNACPSSLTLNDHPPFSPRNDALWADVRALRAAGVKVLGMLGGAAQGSFTRLDMRAPSINDDSPIPEMEADNADNNDDEFEAYYRPLHSLIQQHNLDGLDLDVEEHMSLAGIIRLIDRLKTDFGPSFLITLAPVATALCYGGCGPHNLSGFDYEALEVMRGDSIAWYNVQFYCGWGSVADSLGYEMIIARGWRREKVVVGMVTSPWNGEGWVEMGVWDGVLAGLVERSAGGDAGFGGVMGWEYFNALPGGTERPWEWAVGMRRCLDGWCARGQSRGRGGEEDDCGDGATGEDAQRVMDKFQKATGDDSPALT